MHISKCFIIGSGRPVSFWQVLGANAPLQSQLGNSALFIETKVLSNRALRFLDLCVSLTLSTDLPSQSKELLSMTTPSGHLDFPASAFTLKSHRENSSLTCWTHLEMLEPYRALSPSSLKLCIRGAFCLRSSASQFPCSQVQPMFHKYFWFYWWHKLQCLARLSCLQTWLWNLSSWGGNEPSNGRAH